MENLCINPHVLEEFYGDSYEAMQEVFTEFLGKYADLKKDVTHFYQDKKSADLKTLFHSNGPSFLYVGLPEVSKQFKVMENACMSGTVFNEELKPEYIRLTAMLDLSQALITDFMKQKAEKRA